MRKILFLCIGILASSLSFAQFSTVSFNPASFAGDEEFTFTIDLSGTNMVGETELYIWTWCNKDEGSAYPGRDGVTNTSWGNAPDIAKMVHVSGNIWSYTFTGTEMYGLTPGQLKNFQFLVKTKSGNKQTSDSPKFPFASVAYAPAVYRLFPSRMDQNDAITIYFYQNLATSVNESRMTPTTISVKLYNGTTQVGTTLELPLTLTEQGLYSVHLIPSVAVAIPAGTTLTSFTYQLNGNYHDTNGTPIQVTGPLNTKNFDVLH